MIKEKNQRISTILAFALIPLSGFATDIYIPSLPNMGADLNISSMQVQLTLSLFLISNGIAQLFIGSFLDSFGRYRIGLWALAIFIIACIIVAVTRNIYIIYAMRIIHGITVATVVVAKRAFFVDMFTGDRLKNYLSMFTIIWSAGPILAPFVGGYLQNIFGWESNFYLLAAMGAVLFILELIFSGETLKNPAIFDAKKITAIYVKMISTSSFTLGLFMLGISYSMVMVYNMTGPFIIEHALKFTPVTAGYCSLILGIAWMIGGLIGKATINRPLFKKLFINFALQAIFIAAMIISLGLITNLYSLVFFAFIIHVAAGFTYNNYFTYSMGRFPQNAGIAGGLMGGVAYILVSFLSYGVVNFIPAKDERNLAYSYFVFIILSGVGMYLMYRINKKQAGEPGQIVSA